MRLLVSFSASALYMYHVRLGSVYPSHQRKCQPPATIWAKPGSRVRD